MFKRLSLLCLAAGLSLVAAGCKHLQPLDTKPLDAAGVGYASIKKLEALKITSEEIPEISKMRSAGFSDDSCVASSKFIISAANRSQPAKQWRVS